MISGGQILWNALAIGETSKTSWQTCKLRMNEDLENLSKDQLFHLVHWWNTSQIPREKARIHQFGNEVVSGIFLGYALIAGRIWKGDILVADIEELEKLDASEIYPIRKASIARNLCRICSDRGEDFGNEIL